MSMCDRCRVSGCLLDPGGKACAKTRQRECPDVVETNADHIRAMSDEELAAFLINVDIDNATLPFTNNWLDWLRQPWEEGAHD